jgi:O-antigen/teichoic acid export membrane protein
MSELGRKSLQTFVARVLMQAVGVLGSIVIARTLGAAGKGLFTYAVTALGLILVVNGQSAAIAWQYTKRGRSPAAITRVMLMSLATVCVPLVLALVTVAWLVPGQSVLFWVAAAVPFALFMQSSSGFFLADSDVRTVLEQQAFPAIGTVLVYVPFLVLAHAPVQVLLAAWVAGFVAGSCYTVVRLRAYASATEGDDDGPLVLEQLKYTFQSGLTSLAVFLNFKIDVFIIVAMLGVAQLGVYSIGIAVGEALWEVSRAITTASFGRIARDSEAQAAKATATCMRHCFVFAVLGAAFVAVAAPLVLPIVYGRAFAGSVAVTWWLLPGIVAYSMIGALTTFFLQQLGAPNRVLVYRVMSLAICAALTIALLPRLGIVGGAIATSISYVVSFALAAAYFVRRTGIAPKSLFLMTKSDLVPYLQLLGRLSPSGIPIGTRR